MSDDTSTSDTSGTDASKTDASETDTSSTDPGNTVSEVERLRELVGPSERSYAALRRDRDEAIEVARRAEYDAGRLRGDIAEMSVQLSRARQDQEVLLVQSDMTPVRRVVDRVQRRWTTSVAPRLQQLRHLVRR